jgi:hypothetical protein
MKYLIAFVGILILSCNDNKPVSYEAVQKIKEDSAVNQRMNEVVTNDIEKRLATNKFSPVKIISTEVFNTDHQWITVQVKNESKNTIDGLKVGYFFYNNFNELVKEMEQSGIYQQTIKPGESKSISWNVEATGATKAKAFIEEIHFTNDSTWDYKKQLSRK